MKKIMEKYNSISLILRIIVGMLIGVVLALTVPKVTVIGVLGELFVGALKAIAPLLVCVLIMSSLANTKEGHNGNMKTVVILYMLSTILGAMVAVAGSFLFPLKITLADAAQGSAPKGVAEVLKNLVMKVVSNPVDSLVQANYLGILAWAVILGIALKKASPTTKQALSDLSDAVSKAVRWIINLAPFGILGLVFTAVSTNGPKIFTQYGKLVLLLVGCMLFQEFVTNGLIVGLSLRKNPYPLISRCARESGITAFFTRSSAANIPVNMELCAKLGLNKDNYSVSIPLGSTINMDGAAITITVMTLATAHTLGIQVSIPMALILSLLATLSACGASGIAGGSLLLIPVACSLFGISNDIAMQVVGVGFIIGVIQDSCETALNSSSDVLLTATAEFIQWRKEGRELPF
ncbi:MAG: serine/threonine transporter SstT [Eubacterium sp.]|nr:serine/threonine transporter SstT [Eubacterium sp.]MDD7209605.1 serine/threonine transporter SstT [Lachnospiraceae bacterium]MDY5497197.1 serine/threonine transporter SstT [Anaerobutyricum sp.]